MANSYINVQKKAYEKKVTAVCAVLVLIALAYISLRIGYYQEANGGEGAASWISALMWIFTTPEDIFKVAANSYAGTIFACFGIVTVFLVWSAYDQNTLNKHYTNEESCGTAQWQTVDSMKMFNRKFNAPYGKPTADGAENIIYSKHCQMTMNTRRTGLNNNAMVIGGPGSGKSFNIVRPNLLQAYCSYVVTDPSGELMQTTGRFFEDQGYDVRVFNLVDMARSCTYNPFNYIHSEEDVLTLINCLIKNTEGKGTGGDPFWEKAETALLEAIIFYLRRYQPPKNQNFAMVSKLLRQAKVDPKKGMSQLDAIFDEVRGIDKDDICLKQYDIFKQASDKTAQSILITAAVRLAPFNIKAVEDLTSSNSISLKDIGDKKTITYIIVPQGNNPYAFLVNMMYSQMFDTLYNHAATDCEGLRLKHDVQFILDEFANIGLIPDFQVKLTTMRKYGLACTIFIQAVGQIKNLYKDDWETLMGACDTLVYLGGNELSTMEDLSKKLGVQTIRTKDVSHSHSGSKNGSDSKSFKYTKRELLTVDEIRRLKDGYCIVVIKGQQPFYDEKYKTTEHPNAKHLGSLGDGLNLYTIPYNNRRASGRAELEAKRKKAQERMSRKGASSRKNEDKPYQMAPVPKEPGGEAPMTPEEEAALAKKIANQTASPGLDKEAALSNGMAVRETVDGRVSVTGAPDFRDRKTRGTAATGPVAKPKLESASSEWGALGAAV